MFLHVEKTINHMVLLAISYFRYFFMLSTDEYLPHTVLDCKVIDPQATTSSYCVLESKQGLDICVNIQGKIILESFIACQEMATSINGNKQPKFSTTKMDCVGMPTVYFNNVSLLFKQCSSFF